MLILLNIKNSFALEFYDNFPLPIGLYFIDYPLYYSADKKIDEKGNVVNDDVGFRLMKNLFRLAYWGRTSSGNPYLLNIIIPFGKKEARSINESDSGLGDIFLASSYTLCKQEKLYFLGTVYFKIPTGDFDEEKNINIGDGQFDIWFQLNYAQLINKITLESNLTYIYKFENSKNDFKSGNEYKFESLVGYELSDKLRTGVELSASFSENDKKNGHIIDNSKSKVVQLGPQLFIRISDKVSVNIKVISDVYVRNNLKGTLMHGRLFFAF